MNQNQLLTAGAVAFAGFALWYVFRRPTGGQVAAQPGQAQRDDGLSSWLSQMRSQYDNLGRIDYSLSPDTFGDLLGATPQTVRRELGLSTISTPSRTLAV